MVQILGFSTCMHAIVIIFTCILLAIFAIKFEANLSPFGRWKPKIAKIMQFLYFIYFKLVDWQITPESDRASNYARDHTLTLLLLNHNQEIHIDLKVQFEDHDQQVDPCGVTEENNTVLESLFINFFACPDVTCGIILIT